MNGQQMRITDKELELIKSTYAGNEELLMLLRKIFLPEIDPATPLGQNIDLWMTMKIEDLSPEEAIINLKARNTVIQHIEQQLLSLKLLAGQRDLSRAGIEFDIIDGQFFGQTLRWSAQECLQTRGKFCERERLHQVIVCPREQQIYLGVRLRARGQDEDWGGDVLRAHLFAYLVPVHRGQHEVENNGVVVVAMEGGSGESLLAIGDDVYRIAAEFEPALHGIGKFLFIFY